ncbi:hypothetical protein FA15DRAFT_756736 [Coprinopsis marcescibilis]|uniref:DUF6533 domain-containing protein n=1 Tax=Coprinopsis marcescibilis TaxID=230819 RepID=A0A5C3KU79_COPMA|nr:hypothetical protein FA15DRAFT_756736 [Coprinopsis marcescibilis]
MTPCLWIITSFFLSYLSTLWFDRSRSPMQVFLQAAISTVLIAEYIETFPSEVNYIWPAPWSLIKVLFFLARYSAFIEVAFVIAYSFTERPDVSPATCEIHLGIAGLAVVASIALAEAIFFVRVYALSGRSKPMLFYLVLQWIVVHVGQVALMGHIIRSFAFPMIPHITAKIGCFAFPLPRAIPLLTAMFALPVFSGIALVLIMAYLGLKKFRHVHTTKLITIYFRDGFLYFIVLASLAIANIVLGLNITTCEVYFGIAGISVVVSIALAEAIFFVRVYAISNRSKLLLCYLVFQWTAVHVAQLVLMGYIIRSFEYPATSDLTARVGCFAIPTPRAPWLGTAMFALPVLSGTTLVLIMVYLGLQKFRHICATNLITIYFRDGLLYYIVLASLAIVNTVLSVTVTSSNFTIGEFQGILYTILSCRLILHLRDVVGKTATPTLCLRNHLILCPDSQDSLEQPSDRRLYNRSVEGYEQQVPLEPLNVVPVEVPAKQFELLSDGMESVETRAKGVSPGWV